MTNKAGMQNQPISSSGQAKKSSPPGDFEWQKFKELVSKYGAGEGSKGIFPGFSRDDTEKMIEFIGGHLGMSGFKNAIRSGQIKGLMHAGTVLYDVKSLDHWIRDNLP